MSIVTMKKKSVIQYGSKRSGKPPGGYWLPQGPFGQSTTGLQLAIKNYGPVGFSLNGTHRNIGYVGQNMRMSKQGTPFRGVYPMGSGGCCNTYAQPQPLLNVIDALPLGDQYMYVKQSVLSTKGMLAKKYRYLNNGQFPNYTVKPIYTGNQLDSQSQGVYIQNIASEHDCVVDVNQTDKYVNDIRKCGPTLCKTTTANFKYNDMVRNAPYTKYTKVAQDASQQILRVQRKCAKVGMLTPGRISGNGAPCQGHVGPSPTINYNP